MSYVLTQPVRQPRGPTRYRRTRLRDIFGASRRAMLEAVISGQRNPRMLTAGESVDAHEDPYPGGSLDGAQRPRAFLARTMLDRIDAAIAPFRYAVDQLDEVTGIGPTSAQELIAGIGVDMTRFRTPAHLVS